MKLGLLSIVVLLTICACSPSDEQKQRIADQAVAKAEARAKELRDNLRGAYDEAYEQGRKIAAELGEKASDNILKAKLVAAFKLLKALDSSKIEVRVTQGVIYLDGTTKSEQERMMAEGLAYGITGDGKRVQSTLTVPK